MRTASIARPRPTVPVIIPLVTSGCHPMLRTYAGYYTSGISDVYVDSRCSALSVAQCRSC